MTRRQTLLAITLVVFTVGLAGAVLVLGQSNKQEKSTTSVTHDETNSDNHHSSDSETDTADAEDLTDQSEVSIEIKDFKYAKAHIKIKKGTTVTWTNQDAVEHNVMQDHADGDKPHDPPKANEVNPDVFAGPLLARGESYSFTFNEVGSDPYHCSPHPYMKGSVTVVE